MEELLIVTISKEEYDRLKAESIMLTSYERLLEICTDYTEWSKDHIRIDNDRLVGGLEILNPELFEEIKQTADAKKKEKEGSFPEV